MHPTTPSSLSLWLPHQLLCSLPLLSSIYVALRFHIGCRAMWLVGGRDELELTNVLLKKDDLLWLRVPD